MRIRSGCSACSKLLPQILQTRSGAAVTDLRKPAPVPAQGPGVPSWAFGVCAQPEPLLMNCDVLDKLREAGYGVGRELGRGTYGRVLRCALPHPRGAWQSWGSKCTQQQQRMLDSALGKGWVAMLLLSWAVTEAHGSSLAVVRRMHQKLVDCINA